MKIRGAKIVVECLLEQGVDTVFGYPGGFVLDIFDELYIRRENIKQILTCHEQGASHAADGYARATGKVGVVLATSGPGATNLVTGIATAYMDSIPLVAITGNVPLSLLGRDSFQEVDIAGVTLPITKHNYIVKNVEDLAPTLREAFKIARSGRPGPVLVDIPKNIQQALCEYEPVKIVMPVHKKAEISKMTEAINILKNAKRPVIYAGGGVISSNASNELIEFAELIDCPVAVSSMGLGAFPASHPLFTGMIGMHGHAGVASAVLNSDAIIAIGARFSDRVASNRDKFGKQAKIIQIDIDNAEINKNVATAAHILGDIKEVLTVLNTNLSALKHPEWIMEVSEFIKNRQVKDSSSALNPHNIIRAVSKLTPPDQIIATDVGQHQMWTMQSYRFEKPRTLISSGGLGTMGFGMGAAIGAAIGTKRRSILITGDGSFHMNMNEIVTAVKNDLNIIVLVFNNNVLGMVRQWQKLFYDNRFSSTTLDRPTDYVKLADAFGAKGLKLTKNGDIETVLNEALAYKGVTIVDCKLFSDENVLPMIPAGKDLEDMILEID